MSFRNITPNDKWESIKAGKRVVVSDQELRIIEALDDNVILRLATIPNPDRVGILDAYVAFLK